MKEMVHAFWPAPDIHNQDFGRIIKEARMLKDQGVKVESFVSGEADIAIVSQEKLSVHSIRKVNGILRIVTRDDFYQSGRWRRVEFSYDEEGRLDGKDVSENGAKVYSDRYSYYDYKLTEPKESPDEIKAFDVRRTYPSGKSPDYWKIDNALSDYFPSWVSEFYITWSDPLTPEWKAEGAGKPFDAHIDAKVKEGDEIERMVAYPTLPAGKKIKATLKVERWFPDPVRLSLVRTELVDRS